MLVAVLLRLDFRLKSKISELEVRLDQAEGRLAVLQSLGSDDSRERAVEAKLALLEQQHEQLMLRDSEAGPYFSAVRYAESGASVDALMEQTGVTLAEAQLIVSLHGKYRAEQGGDESSSPLPD